MTNRKKHLATHRYHPITGTTGLWEHETRRTKFCVCVADFGIKYFDKANLEHLLGGLREKYKCTMDVEGKNYCGLTFNWHYEDRYVDVSMPGYVRECLQRLGHKNNDSHSTHHTHTYQ